jgi:hypothetical protein
MNRPAFALLALALASAPLSIAADTPATNPLKAVFKEIKETGMGLRGVYTLTNTGKDDIDDVEIWLKLKDKAGETLSSTAVSDSTPGLVWLKAGASLNESVPLDGKMNLAAKTLLEKSPADGTLVIEIRKISYLKK